MNNDSITSYCNIKATREEMETHIYIDEIEDVCRVESSIAKHYRKLDKLGWEKTAIVKHPDGSVISMSFKAPSNAITFRAVSVREKPAASEEYKAKMAKKMQLLREAKKLNKL